MLILQINVQKIYNSKPYRLSKRYLCLTSLFDKRYSSVAIVHSYLQLCRPPFGLLACLRFFWPCAPSVKTIQQRKFLVVWAQIFKALCFVSLNHHHWFTHNIRHNKRIVLMMGVAALNTSDRGDECFPARSTQKLIFNYGKEQTTLVNYKTSRPPSLNCLIGWISISA